MEKSGFNKGPIMKIHLLCASLLLSVSALLNAAEERIQPAKSAIWQQAHLKIREPHIQSKDYLSILEKLPQTALDSIAENLTYEQLTHLAKGSKTLYERLEPAFRKKLIDYWKQPLAFIEMRPEDPQNRQIILEHPERYHDQPDRYNTYQSVAFSPNGKFVATGSGDAQFLLWQLQAAAPVSVEFILNELISAFPLPDISNIQVIGKKALTIRQLEIPGKHSHYKHVVAFSPMGTMLAGTYSGQGDNKILFWEMPTGKLIDQLNASEEEINSIAFSPDGQLVAADGGEDYLVRLWDLKTRKVKKELMAVNDPLLTISHDGLVAALDNCNDVGLWNLEGDQIATIDIPSETYSIAFSPDGTLLATGSHDGKIRLWRLNRGTQAKIGHRLYYAIKVLVGHNGPVDSLVFSPYTAVLASASEGDRWHEGDRKIRLWDVTTGTQMRQFDGTGPIAFSPDGQLLATCGKKGHMGLWQAYKAVSAAGQ